MKLTLTIKNAVKRIKNNRYSLWTFVPFCDIVCANKEGDSAYDTEETSKKRKRNGSESEFLETEPSLYQGGAKQISLRDYININGCPAVNKEEESR